MVREESGRREVGGSIKVGSTAAPYDDGNISIDCTSQ